MRTAIAIHPIGMIWYYRPVIKRSRIKPAKCIGFLGSVVLHACLLFLGGAVLIKPIEFAVDQGLSGIEVQLVAGVPEPVKPVEIVEPVVEKTAVIEKIEVKVEEQVPPEVIKEIAALKEPAVEPKKVEIEKIEKAIPAAAKPVVKGNSPVNVSTTGQGAETKAKPDYLSNPAPRYPLDARRNGWEGTVLIQAYIDKEGHPTQLELKKSSGHSSLDESALKTVKKWSFSPARVGKMPVESSVLLPVRFNLNDPE